MQRAVAVVVVLLAGAVWTTAPKLRQLRDLARLDLTPLTSLRERIDAYQKAHGGRAPASLSELGPVPPLAVYAHDADGGAHYHAASRETQVLSIAPSYESGEPPSGLKDAGGYAYDPASGRVVIACTGLDPKLGRPFFQK